MHFVLWIIFYDIKKILIVINVQKSDRNIYDFAYMLYYSTISDSFKHRTII